MIENPMKKLVKAQKEGKAAGIYSCCSANKYVLQAALEQARDCKCLLLIESTANQCDQNGGYTGMTPADFRDFVYELADQADFSRDRIILGGDHLGPLTKVHLPEKEAMSYAAELVDAYVRAGFAKIHIDTSMKVADDDPDERLSEQVIARRGAALAAVCEEAWKDIKSLNPQAVRPVYVVGSEVPIPGGAQNPDSGMQVTRPEDFEATVRAFQNAFEEEGLSEAWDNVIAVVVQPGVEEKDAGCTEYDRTAAQELMAAIKDYDHLIYEGHSTDYQTKYKLRELVEDGVGILKVGPGLTYAAREGLFALAYMEEADKTIPEGRKSHFIQILDEAMVKDSKYWGKHYHGNQNDQAFKRKFSFSDRSRYYMPSPEVEEARERMIANFKEYGINLATLSQFMPLQYTKVREGELDCDAEALIKDKVKYTINEYMYATRQQMLG